MNNPMSGMDPRNPGKSATRCFAITPNDSTNLAEGTRAIWVGGAGNIKVTLVDDDGNHGGFTLVAVPAGTLLPLAARRVYATGTTATQLIGLS
jgi:hypothetical protein